MKKPAKILVMFATPLLLLAPLAVAQQTTPQSPPPAQIQPASSPPQTEQMQNMDKMATSVTHAAEMCQMMMQKEMATMHYKIAAGVAFGVILFIDLLLLGVLEIQWIVYWARLLREQKRRAIG